MAKNKSIKNNHGTNKTYMPRVRKEFVDMDYMKDLPEKDKAWMEKFASEYYCGSLNAEKPWRNLHKTKKKIKECFDRNNHQNNDLYGVTNVNGLLDKDLLKHDSSIEAPNSDVFNKTQYTHPAQYTNPGLTEMALIEYIDNKELLEYDTKELSIVYENLDDPEFFKKQSSSLNKRGKRSGKLNK